MDFLLSPEGRELMTQKGYRIPQKPWALVSRQVLERKPISVVSSPCGFKPDMRLLAMYANARNWYAAPVQIRP